MGSHKPHGALQNPKCNHTYGDLLSIKACSDPAVMHCIPGLSKMHFPLFSAALQKRLTAGLCLCNHTYGDLLSIQVCSDPTEVQCIPGMSKMQFPLFSAALHKRPTAGLCLCNHTYGELLSTQVCSDATEMLCIPGMSKMQSSLTEQWCSAKQAESRLVSLQSHLWGFALQTLIATPPKGSSTINKAVIP